MKTQHWNDEVACHLFPTVLNSAAREWFAKLPPNRITCFADLREKFLMQYQNLRRHTYTHLYAHEIPMYQGEKIESFITRYMLECQKIPGLPETQQISGFITCLDKDAHPSLVSKLHWNIPGTFTDAATVARQYQHSGRERQAGYHREERKREEERRSDSRHCHDSSRRSESHSKHHNSHSKSHDSHQHDKGSRKPYDKGSLIDSLSKTQREILLPEPVKAKFTPLASLEKRDGQKSDKYCEFHEDNGHDTDECKALIREIIAKIKVDELNHLLSGRKFKKADPNKTFSWQKEDGKKREKAKDKVVINMINVQKDEFAPQNSWKYATITFPRIPTWYSWNEAVVITGLIDGFPVKETYTDTESEVGVLYTHCLSRLPKCVGRKMRQSNAIISGISGHAEETIGRLKATVTVGTRPYLRSEVIDFCVIKSVTAMNVILGRQFFKKFGAIASTAHGILKFLTRQGVVMVQSTRHPFPGNEAIQNRQDDLSWRTPHVMEEERVSVLKRLTFFSPTAHSGNRSSDMLHKADKAIASRRRRSEWEKSFSACAERLNPIVRHSNVRGPKVVKVPTETR
ncbi:uncharacterized protein [Rutidosis leptorrhynchoides]|uniref:uncharacterized protein n=1 Tax=Rutidosis leptorrhynchoides TaxID=125765 RepID=UPI003A9A09BF